MSQGDLMEKVCECESLYRMYELELQMGRTATFTCLCSTHCKCTCAYCNCVPKVYRPKESVCRLGDSTEEPEPICRLGEDMHDPI